MKKLDVATIFGRCEIYKGFLKVLSFLKLGFEMRDLEFHE